MAFDWLSERSGEKTSHARELSRNQSILRFDVMLQHHWPIEQCLPHIRVFFGGKTKSPCFDLFIHWLIKQIMNTYRNHFSRPYENRSNAMDSGFQVLDSVFFVSETWTPDSVGFRWDSGSLNCLPDSVIQHSGFQKLKFSGSGFYKQKISRIGLHRAMS